MTSEHWSGYCTKPPKNQATLPYTFIMPFTRTLLAPQLDVVSSRVVFADKSPPSLPSVCNGDCPGSGVLSSPRGVAGIGNRGFRARIASLSEEDFSSLCKPPMRSCTAARKVAISALVGSGASHTSFVRILVTPRSQSSFSSSVRAQKR